MRINMNLSNSINWKSGVPAKVADSNTSSESILHLPPVRTRTTDQNLINSAVKTLTAEQKQQLRDKYDIHNMAIDSPEHEALMKELRDLGAISDDDYITSRSTLIHVSYPDGYRITHEGEEQPPWSAENVGNDMYKYYFYGQDQFMKGYSDAIASKALPADLKMKMADTQLSQSMTFGRIADVLRDIFQ